MAIVAALFSFLFLRALEQYLVLQPQLALQDHPPGLTGYLAIRFLAPLALVFAILGPLFSMHSLSDEFRQHTMELWQSSPVPNTALVLGKYLGVLSVLLVLVCIAIGMPLLMRFFVPVDLGVLLSSALGLSLIAAACTATGLYFSSLTQQSAIAIVASLSLLLLLWLLGSASFGDSPLLVLRTISFGQHLSGFFQGYINSRDVAYFLLFILLFIVLTVIRLDALRHNNSD